MKIKVTHKKRSPNKQLEVGVHPVKITEVTEGTSANKQTEFFACRFQNEYGSHTQRFYNTEKTLSIILELFEACNIPTNLEDILDTEQLKGKEIIIRIRDYNYPNPDSGEIIHSKTAYDYQKPLIQSDTK